MPQLDVSSFPNQIFWLLVALVATYLILSRVALPRIGGVLAERQGTIEGDLIAAEELRLKAKEAEAAYEKALAEARAEAQQIVADTRAAIGEDLALATQKADAEIAARTAESERRIGEIRDGATAAVDAVARDVAVEIVTSMGGRADTAALNTAIDTRLKG